MRIVYCIAGTRHSGGMERVLANKANWLVNHGYEVVIVTTDQQGEAPFFALDERIRCYDLNIGYEENNGGSFLNKLVHYPVKQYRHRKLLSALLMKLKADVVVSMFCNDASFLPKIHDGSKKVLEIHFSRYKLLQYGRKGLWALADRWRSDRYEKVALRYDQFVVLTEEDRGYWDEDGTPAVYKKGRYAYKKGHLWCTKRDATRTKKGEDGHTMVIPNARTFACAKPAELKNKEVLAVGRYNYQKGYDRLIEVWAAVHQQMPEWKLRIVGDGELRESLEQQARELGLSDSIIFGKAQKDIISVYQSASVLAMTSHYEGLPMVLLEAQAAGLPIVSFDCKCGPKDIIENGVNGYLVRDGDTREMANRIIELMLDEELRKGMGAQAYKDSERFDEKRIMHQWVKLFESLRTK